MEVLQEEHSILTRETKIYPTTFSYKWTIQNFHEHSNVLRTNSITSPLFRTSSYRHYFRIYPSGMHDSIFVSIVLHHDEAVEENVIQSDVDFFILDNAKELVNRKRGKRFGTSNFICESFIRKADLFKQDYLNRHDLTVVCTFTEPTEDNLNGTELECRKCGIEVTLLNDLEKLLKDKSQTDVTLVVNDKKLSAHKFILMARSPVFAAMLQNDMEEKVKSEIVIKDFDADIIAEMMQFMYTEKVTNIKDHFQDLLYLSNKYDIVGLKNICENFMFSELTIDNVIEVFMLAESQNCTVLKPKLLKFIIKHATAVVRNSKFESSKRNLPPLLIEILEALA